MQTTAVCLLFNSLTIKKNSEICLFILLTGSLSNVSDGFLILWKLFESQSWRGGGRIMCWGISINLKKVVNLLKCFSKYKLRKNTNKWMQ